MLHAFRAANGGALHATTLVVLSRADEVGSGQLEAMTRCPGPALRTMEEPAVRALGTPVTPVAGLLGLAGRLLRHRDFTALRSLASAPRSDVEDILLTADRFLRRGGQRAAVGGHADGAARGARPLRHPPVGRPSPGRRRHPRRAGRGARAAQRAQGARAARRRPFPAAQRRRAGRRGGPGRGAGAAEFPRAGGRPGVGPPRAGAAGLARPDGARSADPAARRRRAAAAQPPGRGRAAAGRRGYRTWPSGSVCRPTPARPS